MDFAVGSLVKARGREWVVLPDSQKDLLLLRPTSEAPPQTGKIIFCRAGLINLIILGGRTYLIKIKKVSKSPLDLLCELCASLIDLSRKSSSRKILIPAIKGHQKTLAEPGAFHLSLLYYSS